MLPVTRGTSLKLPGRAAHSRGRTSTGKSHGIHGILSGTFFLGHVCKARRHQPVAEREESAFVVPTVSFSSVLVSRLGRGWALRKRIFVPLFSIWIDVTAGNDNEDL